jgi:hypothetical protein
MSFRHGVVASVALWLLLSGRATAQDNPFHALAEHLTARGPYRGPLVALDGAPGVATDATQIRPARGEVVLCALERPLCVHGTRQDAARAPRLLAALGRAYDWLLLAGWPLPYPDGGAGGTLEHDLYLVAGTAMPLAAGAVAEQLATATPLDSASSFGLLDRTVSEQALASCALVALAEAGLLARDPAEAPQLRQASAAVAAWIAEGTWGCELDAEQAQRDAHLGLLGGAPAQVAAAAQWLAWLDERHHGGSGGLVRSLWELASQRSEGPSKLHARPTLWEALDRVLDRSGETLDADAEELALQRALAPQALGLAASASVVLAGEGSLDKLPFAVGSREPLASYGSAYVRVDAPAARADTPLRVWLRADPDARWSLRATRLDEHGESLGTIAAPPRKLPESFLPIELTPDTRALLITVTALPLQRPGERVAFDEHHFRVTVGRAQ